METFLSVVALRSVRIELRHGRIGAIALHGVCELAAFGERTKRILKEIAADLLGEFTIIEDQRSAGCVVVRCRGKEVSIFFEDGEAVVRKRLEAFVKELRG